MAGLFIRLRTWWENADRNQRLVTVFGGAFLLVLLIGTFVVASRPKMATVFANLSPGDAGSVQMEIEALGLPVTMDEGGNIRVPSDKVAFVRARLAQNNKLPKSAHPGYEGLTSMGYMNTPKVEEERLKSMLEGELAKSVELFDGVDAARVHITFGVDSPFVSEKKRAQASVTVSERAGATINAVQGKAIATLVASSVPGLDAKAVSVFTRSGQAIFDGSSSDEGSTQAVTKLELERKESVAKRDELQQILNQVVGPGNAIVSVNVALNVDQVNETKDSQEPTEKAISEEKINESMGGGNPNAAVGGVGPGESNIGQPATPPNSSTSSGDYTMKHSNVQRGVNRTVSSIVKGVGEIKGMSVTVFLNKPKAGQGEDQAKLDAEAPQKEEAVRRAVNTFLGLQRANPGQADPDLSQPLSFVPKEGYTGQIISYPFDDKIEVASTKAASEAQSSARFQQILSILPIAALVGLGFFVMRALSKIGRAALPNQPQFAAAGVGMLPSGSLALPDTTLHIPGSGETDLESLKRRAREAGVSEDELEAAIASAGEKGLSIEDIPSIANRVNLPLEQIRKMGEERPEVVAALVKSWLLEDRK